MLFFFTAFTAITTFLTKIHRIHGISYKNIPKNFDPGENLFWCLWVNYAVPNQADSFFTVRIIVTTPYFRYWALFWPLISCIELHLRILNLISYINKAPLVWLQLIKLYCMFINPSTNKKLSISISSSLYAIEKNFVWSVSFCTVDLSFETNFKNWYQFTKKGILLDYFEVKIAI